MEFIRDNNIRYLITPPNSQWIKEMGLTVQESFQAPGGGYVVNKISRDADPVQ